MNNLDNVKHYILSAKLHHQEFLRYDFKGTLAEAAKFMTDVVMREIDMSSNYYHVIYNSFNTDRQYKYADYQFSINQIMDKNDFKEHADFIRGQIEDIVSSNDTGGLINFFDDNIYGMDEDGRIIIGFGVYGGNGHIVVCPTCVSVCNVDSEPFSRAAMKAMEEIITMLT